VVQLCISPRTREDLIEIWSYVAEDSVTNADAFIDKLHETMQMLCRQPGSGRRCGELAAGIQSFPFGRYIIFYRATASAIEIVRVLHGARDIGNIFEVDAPGAG
jgi:toxin ParE1/3/4